MKLEELPAALHERNEKIALIVRDDAAPVANRELLTELRKRIMADGKPVKRKAARTIDDSLNSQQQKFLKQMPDKSEYEDADNSSEGEAVQIRENENGYLIEIDSKLASTVKERAAVNDTDVQQYKETLIDNTKKHYKKL